MDVVTVQINGEPCERLSDEGKQRGNWKEITIADFLFFFSHFNFLILASRIHTFLKSKNAISFTGFHIVGTSECVSISRFLSVLLFFISEAVEGTGCLNWEVMGKTVSPPTPPPPFLRRTTSLFHQGIFFFVVKEPRIPVWCCTHAHD